MGSGASTNATHTEADLKKAEAEAECTGFCGRSNMPMFKHNIAVGLMRPMVRKMVNGKVAINENKADCTDEQVKEHEWNVKGPESPSKGKDWENWKAYRPYCVKGYENKGPKAGAKAPDGAVLSLEEGGAPSTLLAELKKMTEGKEKKMAAVIFGSITCPVWRMFAAMDLHKKVVECSLPILHVYTLEAHAADEFAIPVNAKGPMSLTTVPNAHKTEAERRLSAKAACEMASKETGASVTMMMDGMDNKLETAYETRPWRLYVIDTAKDEIVLAGGMGPYNVPAKLKDIQAKFGA